MNYQKDCNKATQRLLIDFYSATAFCQKNNGKWNYLTNSVHEKFDCFNMDTYSAKSITVRCNCGKLITCQMDNCNQYPYLELMSHINDDIHLEYKFLVNNKKIIQ